MVWLRDNRGNVILAVVVVLLGVLLGMLVHGGWRYSAEAVIGGIGNVSDSDNPHNLSNTSSGIRAENETQICIFCHTPHGAINSPSLIDGPLWNHTLSTESYAVKSPGLVYNQAGFGSLIINLNVSPPTQPDGTSKMCLSCHDGTVGLGALNSRSTDISFVANSCVDSADGSLTNSAGCNAYIGNILTSKHVVSIPMNAALISASASNCSIAGQTYKVKYPWDGATAQTDSVLLRPTMTQFGGASGVTRTTGKYRSGYYYGVQCSSCHDPHYWVNTTDSSVPGYKFIVVGFNDLCLACHEPCP